MENYNDESQRLVNDNSINPSLAPQVNRPYPQPIPANRLALDAQIQAAAEYQRRLRQRRRIYYIILITSVTMITFSILSFVAWIIHSSSQQSVQAKSMPVEQSNDILKMAEDVSIHKQTTLNARRHPTRTINDDKKIKKLIQKAEQESDEEKDEDEASLKMNSRFPTRTRKLSFAPEKIIDYKPKFHPI